jgi:hypothetical protein
MSLPLNIFFPVAASLSIFMVTGMRFGSVKNGTQRRPSPSVGLDLELAALLGNSIDKGEE